VAAGESGGYKRGGEKRVRRIGKKEDRKRKNRYFCAKYCMLGSLFLHKKFLPISHS